MTERQAARVPLEGGASTASARAAASSPVRRISAIVSAARAGQLLKSAASYVSDWASSLRRCKSRYGPDTPHIFSLLVDNDRHVDASQPVRFPPHNFRVDAAGETQDQPLLLLVVACLGHRVDATNFLTTTALPAET